MRRYYLLKISIMVLASLLLAGVSQSVPAQDAEFRINAGLSGSWANEDTPGQGFFLEINPDSGLVWMSWFTWGDAANDAASVIGSPSNHWYVALGTIPEVGLGVDMNIIEVAGGVFDAMNVVTETTVGTIQLGFQNCSEATVEYAFDAPGPAGQIPLSRLTPADVCLALSQSE